jgi:hypothetical protein
MFSTIRRAVALTTLTAAILIAVPAPSHAAQSRGAALNVSASDLMTQALSWLQGFLGVSAPVSHRAATLQKDSTTTPPPPIPFPPPPGTGGGSGSMTDPDGKAK